MPSNNDPEAKDVAAARAAEAAPANPAHQALAGALPDWDLVPPSPFIRRH